MEPIRELGKALLFFGLVFVAVGALLVLGFRPGGLLFRLGRLPGDILYRGDRTTFHFPIVTCLVLSLLLTLLFWLVSLFRR